MNLWLHYFNGYAPHNEPQSILSTDQLKDLMNDKPVYPWGSHSKGRCSGSYFPSNFSLLLWTWRMPGPFHRRNLLTCAGCRRALSQWRDILLEKNGQAFSSKQTKHIEIQYYYIADHIEKGNLTVVWCPTKKMIADFLTKPLQGKMFQKIRDVPMGVVPMWYDTD